MNLNNIDYFKCFFDSGVGEQNDDFFIERKHLGGWTVSNRHPIKNLNRYPPKENIVSNKILHVKIQDLRKILEDIIKKYATDKNVILLSGGKDSTTLAHIFKKLDIPFVPVSLFSGISLTTEKSIVNRIELDLEINVIYYRIDSIPKIEFPYWIENPYTAKINAINNLELNDYTIFTGEIGTGEMQVNQALQYTAMMGYDPKALSRWHVNVCGSYRKSNSVLELYDDDIYKECIEHFENRFSEWDKHPDILNRVMFTRLQDEGAYRIFNCEDDNLNWVHPFAENEFIHSCVNMSSEHKGKKNLYREMYPELTNIPWEYPKSGLGIPTMRH